MSGHTPWREIRRQRDPKDPDMRALGDAADVALAIEARRASAGAELSDEPAVVELPHASAGERSEGLFLESLAGYVKSIGGELEISVRFPGSGPISLVAAPRGPSV